MTERKQSPQRPTWRTNPYVKETLSRTLRSSGRGSSGGLSISSRRSSKAGTVVKVVAGAAIGVGVWYLASLAAKQAGYGLGCSTGVWPFCATSPNQAQTDGIAKSLQVSYQYGPLQVKTPSISSWGTCPSGGGCGGGATYVILAPNNVDQGFVIVQQDAGQASTSFNVGLVNSTGTPMTFSGAGLNETVPANATTWVSVTVSG